MKYRYNSIKPLLVSRFGERVYKVSLQSGFGCPNRDGTLGARGCSFCSDEALVPSTLTEVQGTQPVWEQLASGVAYIRERHGAKRVIAYFNEGSNTYAPAHTLACTLSEAISHPAVVGLAMSTRPDCVDEGNLPVLESVSRRTFMWVELGLQSAHERTLERIGRGHTVERFSKSAKLLQSRGIRVCAHVILGLPGETPEMMRETARHLNGIGVWGVKIHNLHVLRGTRLELEYNEGRLELAELGTYASWACDFLEELDPRIVVHRVNAHGPRRLTVAPDWSVNKLAVVNAVNEEMERRNSFQGIRCSPDHGSRITDHGLRLRRPSPSPS